VVVRDDLSPGMQMAQAMHAAIEFQHDSPDLAVPWRNDSRYLVVVSVPDELSLYDLVSQACKVGIAFSAFREPDLDYEVTAVALQPGTLARQLCSRYPLALRHGTRRLDSGDLGRSRTETPSATIDRKEEVASL
jgi:peptidyl-tRNA hydrolase